MANFKNIVLLLAAAQGLFLSTALILANLKKHQANIFLGLVLMVFSVELLNTWAMPMGYHSRQHVFPFWLLASYWIIPASLWLFFKANTVPNFKIKRAYLLAYIPALVEMLTEFISFYLKRYRDISFALQEFLLWVVFTEILPVVAMVSVLGYHAIQLRKYVLRIGSKNNSHLKRQYGFFIAFTCLTLLWIADTVLQLNVFFLTESLLCIFLFGLGYVIYFQPSFFEIPIPVKSKTTDEIFANHDEEKDIQRIEQFFKENKIYLKPKLTLEYLAYELKLQERYVSFLIRKYHQTNFSNFVNQYRVNEVLVRLKDPKESHKTILGIALDSGFSSKSAFNEIFKTITGKKPSQYLKKTEK